ncbi:MAG: hypothetical protein ACP5HS_02995 [Anaerolineae bacterium]
MTSSVRICSSAGTRTVPMGRTAHIDVVLDGLPETAFGYVLLPFVNGRRWGAHELVSTERTIALHLPLPDPGPAFVEVVLLASDTEHWMGLSDPSLLMVGQRIPAYGVHSNVLHVEVVWRDFPARKPLETLFCMQWEPWFTTGIAHWRTAQSVPMVGFYDSFNADVTRQHILWFMDLGVDFIMPDWSNHIWGCDHWDERSGGVNRILHATELTLEVLASMRDEGLPVPKVALMPGLSNGPPATMGALNEELAWVYHTYLRNPRFAGLWQELEGKPLVVVLDTGAVAHPDGTAASAFEIPFFQQTLGMSDDELDAFRAEQPPVDDAHFTVRWMSSQNQTTRHHELGYWSWMDGVADPPVTYRDGEAEAVTVTPSFFNAQGWTGPLARGRRGGATYLETFRQALAHRPKVVLLHQFNEFTGQQEGQGYGPNNSIYVDTYSVELSDDLEPVSLTAPGYRGDGGWGFTYLNLTQALMALYRDGAEAVGTLLAVSQPLRGATVRGLSLAVVWSVLGKPVEAFIVSLDGQVVGEHVQGTVFEHSLSDVASGPHVVTVTAKGAMTRYPLSQTELDEPLSAPIPVRVTVPFRVD